MGKSAQEKRAAHVAAAKPMSKKWSPQTTNDVDEEQPLFADFFRISARDSLASPIQCDKMARASCAGFQFQIRNNVQICDTELGLTLPFPSSSRVEWLTELQNTSGAPPCKQQRKVSSSNEGFFAGFFPGWLAQFSSSSSKPFLPTSISQAEQALPPPTSLSGCCCSQLCLTRRAKKRCARKCCCYASRGFIQFERRSLWDKFY